MMNIIKLVLQFSNKLRKFSESKNKQVRIQILTLAPEFWSRKNLMREFNCSEREAREAKDLVANSGIFSIPAMKRGKLLPADTVNSVKYFYERDDVSRISPCLKDYLSIKQSNGKRQHIQKRLLLGNLNELCNLYKKEYEYANIGFTKFTELRPP